MGQMIEDIRLAVRCQKEVTLCNRVGGMIPSPSRCLKQSKTEVRNNGGI